MAVGWNSRPDWLTVRPAPPRKRGGRGALPALFISGTLFLLVRYGCDMGDSLQAFLYTDVVFRMSLWCEQVDHCPFPLALQKRIAGAACAPALWACSSPRHGTGNTAGYVCPALEPALAFGWQPGPALCRPAHAPATKPPGIPRWWRRWERPTGASGALICVAHAERASKRHAAPCTRIGDEQMRVCQIERHANRLCVSKSVSHSSTLPLMQKAALASRTPRSTGELMSRDVRFTPGMDASPSPIQERRRSGVALPSPTPTEFEALLVRERWS